MFFNKKNIIALHINSKYLICSHIQEKLNKFSISFKNHHLNKNEIINLTIYNFDSLKKIIKDFLIQTNIQNNYFFIIALDDPSIVESIEKINLENNDNNLTLSQSMDIGKNKISYSASVKHEHILQYTLLTYMLNSDLIGITTPLAALYQIYQQNSSSSKLDSILKIKNLKGFLINSCLNVRKEKIDKNKLFDNSYAVLTALGLYHVGKTII